MKNAKYAKMKKTFPEIRENTTLAPYTSFNIGGPAELFVEPKTQEEFIALLTEAKRLKIRTFILGGGSNTLFSEKGFRGLVIHPQLKKISTSVEADGPEIGSIIAESGALLSQLVQVAAKNQLSGIAGWIGLPGTVGGAVRGNAGASGIETGSVLSSATIYDLSKHRIVEYSAAQLEFAYRESAIKHSKHLFILSATFTFIKKLSTAEQQKEMQIILKKRQLTQPKGKSAGCAFKNVPQRSGGIDSAPESVDSPLGVPNYISAGRLIDECGLKGLRIGGIEVSTVHGNFLQNVSTPAAPAKQKDVLDIIKRIKTEVYKKRKIRLHEEIEIVPYK